MTADMGNMKGLDADTHNFIQSAPLLLAAPDNDEGGRAAWQRWNATYPQAILSPAVGQKDLGEMHAAALRLGPEPTLGEWCAAALSLAHKIAVATVEGKTATGSFNLIHYAAAALLDYLNDISETGIPPQK